MSCYQCKFFEPEELVSSGYILTLESKRLPVEFVYRVFDSRLLLLIDFLREQYGPMIVNNWNMGGGRTECGLRTPDMETYSPTSQHTFGRAVDAIFMNVTAQTIRNDFLFGTYDRWLKRNRIQVTLEQDVDWLHIDVRNADNLVNFFHPL